MADFEVYTGFWHDYSAGGVGAGVLTLPISSAGYLISGLTLLVTLSGTAFWGILAYVWHQSMTSSGEPVDLPHIQRQVLLRNVDTPFSAIVHAAKMSLAWRRTKKSHLLRFFPVAFAAGAIMILFTVAGVFVGRAIASPSEEDILVLAKPGLCGEATLLYSENSNSDAAATSFTWTTSKALRGRTYAKVWYATGDNASLPSGSKAGSSAFPARRLPYTTSRVPCPFPGTDRCRFSIDNTSDANMAITFDTGLLDTVAHLGINGPVERSLQLRRKTTCMPFRATDLGSIYVEDGENYTALRLGPYQGPGNITRLYNLHLANEQLGYVVGGVAFNPGSSTNGSWQPIPLLSRNDSIVAAYNVLTNNLNYLDPVFDPLFLASGVNNDTSSNRTIYFGDYFATTLVCLDQFQYCNPLNGRCTAETYDLEASKQGFRGLGLNDYQKALVWRVGKAFAQTFTFDSGIGVLGVSGLLANEVVFEGILSPSLPPDQWIREVRLWFETALAMLQELTLTFLDVSGFNDTTGAFKVEPVSNRSVEERRAAEWQCTGQKIRSRGQVQNFNVVAIVAIVVITGSILLIGLLLEPCVAVFRGRCKRQPGQLRERRPGELRQFSRATDNLYWLLYAGLRSSEAHPWQFGSDEELRDKEIPIIDAPVQFWPPINDDYSWAPFYRCKPSSAESSPRKELGGLKALEHPGPEKDRLE